MQVTQILSKHPSVSLLNLKDIAPVITQLFNTWKCTGAQRRSILCMTHSELDDFVSGCHTTKYTKDLESRISMILTIHDCLVDMCPQNDSAHLFLLESNVAAPFFGRKPISIMCEGLSGLASVQYALDRIREQ